MTNKGKTTAKQLFSFDFDYLPIFTSIQPNNNFQRANLGKKKEKMASKDIQHWSTGAPWIDLHCALGEGPYYEPATDTLRFVDIIKKQLHTVSLSQGPDSLSTQTFLEAVAVTADIEGVDPRDKILVGVKQGIAVLDRQSGNYEYVSRYADAGKGSERIRSNDGAVDPHGRFWLGTMTDFPYGSATDEGEFPLFSAAVEA